MLARHREYRATSLPLGCALGTDVPYFIGYGVPNAQSTA